MSFLDEQIARTFGTDLNLAIIRARRLHFQARRQSYIDLIDLFNGAQSAMLDEDLKAAGFAEDTIAALQSCRRYSNLVKWVISEGSRALDEPPLVKLNAKGATDDGKGLTDLWSRLDDLGQLWTTGAQVEQYGNLTNNPAVIPTVRQDEDDGQVHLAWDLYPPDRYAVAQRWNRPDQASAVALYFVIEDDESAGRMNQRGYQTWTAETMRYFDTYNHEMTEGIAKKAGQTYGVGLNPYADLFGIPVVFFRIGRPLFGEFFCPSADELGSANRQLNVMRTERRLMERMQGFSQMVVTNGPDTTKEKLYVGMIRTVEIKSDKDRPGDVKYITPDPKLTELRRSEEQLVQETASAWGLNAKDFMVFENAPREAQSGKAKRIDNERLLKRTRKTQSDLRPSFIKLIKHTLLVVKYWDAQGVKLPGVDASLIPDSMDAIDVDLRFAQEPSLQTPEDFALFKSRAQVGLDCYADEFMQEHPEINSRAEAEESMIKAIESNDRVAQAGMMNQIGQALLAAQGVPVAPAAAGAAAAKPGEKPTTGKQEGAPAPGEQKKAEPPAKAPPGAD